MSSQSEKRDDEKKKDGWDKFQIIGSLSTAAVLAVATYLGTTIIPEKINKQSLESQKIIKLSELVPQLYGPKPPRPIVIAMASYGAPAVPFLLRSLNDATENDTTKETTDFIEAITSTMKYLDEAAKNEVKARLKFEIDRLSEQHLTHNVNFIGHIVSILSASPMDCETLDILEEYFSIVSEFKDNKEDLKELNAKILRALFDNGFPIAKLKLAGIDFEAQDLNGIDFSNTNLRDTNLIECIITDCSFEGANLENCDLTGVDFDSTNIHSIAKTNWQQAIVDADARTKLSIEEKRLSVK